MVRDSDAEDSIRLHTKMQTHGLFVGTAEVYKWSASEGNWEKFGDVVDGAGSSGSSGKPRYLLVSPKLGRHLRF